MGSTLEPIVQLWVKIYRRNDCKTTLFALSKDVSSQLFSVVGDVVGENPISRIARTMQRTVYPLQLMGFAHVPRAMQRTVYPLQLVGRRSKSSTC